MTSTAGSSRVLVVEDDASLGEQIRSLLEADGLEVSLARDLAAARRLAGENAPDVYLLDFELPDGTALDLIPHLRELDHDAVVLVLTGHAQIDLAVACVKAGADQFLTKPVELAALRLMVRSAAERRRLSRRETAKVLREKIGPDPFVGGSRRIRALEREARVAAEADSPTLLVGETGTGKGVLARWLHSRSSRSRESFVDLNCAGLSRELLDTELFGHVRGAFTGAVQNKSGLFEVADRGMLFLDEIGDIEVAIQPKILKVVEDKRFRRLGETVERRVDVRLVAATHHDLEEAVNAGQFRADLFYRLNTLTLRLLPLRDRREDIVHLAAAILERIRQETGRYFELRTSAVERLVEHDWPGNIRELGNVLERAALYARNGAIAPDDLTLGRSTSQPTPGSGAVADDDLRLAAVERRHIENVLRLERGQVDRAAARLEIPRSTLYQRIKEYGLSPAHYRRGGDSAAES
ncbi:MAG TPA: sigma-54 dependent transcriptional regulator [Thermoanaerobaculia bacterium]|nr:sigma-54 dependent transcriptional regulator [Thermoanaerobaculia bacterium]